ncbi:solute carrier family 41 member 1-like [Uloborus diversus]|uniref:solute carrier family 41 member 1-like n=1 Tax=Uloborus diversus TaxID=327109 RepID=UPI002409E308|nr:solute carrier family 41 member 1-like [Uloborus diversus]
MAREIVELHDGKQSTCALLRQMSAPVGHEGRNGHVPLPITAPGNLQCPLEFWIQSETTPLLLSAQKAPLPPKKDFVVSTESLLPPVKEEEKSSDDDSFEKDDKEETVCSITCQVFVPFMIAGFGTVAAGLLLDIVQNWNVFQEVPEMFVLVPALLGLKGNLEMTLASRISTLANMGTIDTPKEQWRMAFGNLSLLQCQSLVLGLIASMFASIVGWIREGEVNFHNILLLSSSSLLTASVASFLLGSITIFVVVFSRKMNINPDNVAAPISASLGDVVTLALLSFIARFIFERSGQYVWVEASIVIGMLFLIPFWAWLSYRNSYTRHVLYSGWIPIISAVAISSGGGYILNFAVARYKEIAACQPVINGVGGNLVAVQACRISTYLHKKAKPGVLSAEELCVSPFTAWFGRSLHSRTCRILVLIAVPGHLIFISCVHFLKSTYTPLTAEFLLFYLIAAILQVSILLYMAHCFVHWLWKWGFDPDDAAIPYLTAFGDLLGTGFLLVAFLAMDAA